MSPALSYPATNARFTDLKQLCSLRRSNQTVRRETDRAISNRRSFDDSGFFKSHDLDPSSHLDPQLLESAKIAVVSSFLTLCAPSDLKETRNDPEMILTK